MAKTDAAAADPGAQPTLKTDEEKDTAGGEETTQAEALPEPVGPKGLRPGDRICAKGLVATPQLNGSPGKVMAWYEDKGRYAVRFTSDGTQKLLKPDNIERPVADADALRAIFMSDTDTTGKVQRLTKSGDLGFARMDDPKLCDMLTQLIAVGYWKEAPEFEQQLAKSLELAKHPSAPQAIKMIRRLECADNEYVGKILDEVGEQVRKDEGLIFVFDVLKAMGHAFQF